jgi:Pilus formation protein N terminal region
MTPAAAAARGRLMKAGALAMVMIGTLLVSTAGHAAEDGRVGDTPRVYVTIDKTEVVDFSAPPTKVSVTNPAVADIVVVSPTRILVNGKGMGETSLLVFYGSRVQGFDLVVHPAPPFSPRSPLVPAAAHPVEVLRAGRSSYQLFVRDSAEAWVPLGNGKLESEASKK